MVRAVFLSLMMLSATPAMAQGENAPGNAAIDRLTDPATADAVATLAEAITRTILAMPVGDIADAMRQIDPDSRLADLPADATVGDLARGDAVDPRQIGDDTHAAATMAAGMMRQLVTMMPVITAMARDIAAQWSAQWDATRRASRRR